MKILSVIQDPEDLELQIQTSLTLYTIWEEDGEVTIAAPGLRLHRDISEFPSPDLIPIALYLVAELETQVYGY